MQPLHTIIEETEKKYNKHIQQIKDEVVKVIDHILSPDYGTNIDDYKNKIEAAKKKKEKELEIKFEAYSFDKAKIGERLPASFKDVGKIPDIVGSNLHNYLSTNNKEYLEDARDYVDTSKLAKKENTIFNDSFYIDNRFRPKPNSHILYGLIGGALGIMAANVVDNIVSPEEVNTIYNIVGALVGIGIGGLKGERVAKAKSNVYKSLIRKAEKTSEYINARPNLKKIIEDYKQ